MKVLTVSKYITDCNQPLTLYVTYFTSTSRHRKIQNFQSKVLDDLICHDVTFHICESVSANYTLWRDKNDDVINLLSCDTTPIFFSAKAYTTISRYHSHLALLSYRKYVTLQRGKIKMCNSCRSTCSKMFLIIGNLVKRDSDKGVFLWIIAKI